MTIYLKETPHGASDNILNFICYYNLALKLKTNIYFDWSNSLVNFPLKSKYRAVTPSGIPHFDAEHFFASDERESFVKCLSSNDFSVGSIDCRGMPLLTYTFPEDQNLDQVVTATTKVFFEEFTTYISDQVTTILNELSGQNLIGTHFRLGDSLIAGEDWQKYKNIISNFYSILKRSIPAKSNIFLGSDYKNEELTIFIKEILGEDHNYLNYFSPPKHSMYSQYDSSDWNNYFFDILMLSKSSNLYISPNSNVSRLATFLGLADNPDLNVFQICPFENSINKVSGLPSKKYNAWKLDGRW